LTWLPFFELTLLITLILPCGCHQALLTVTCWGRWRTDQLLQDSPVTFAKVESSVMKFSQKILWLPQERFHFLVRLPNGFGDYCQIWFLRCSSDDPNKVSYSVIQLFGSQVTQITEFDDSFFLVAFRSSGKLASFTQNQIQYIHALVNPFVDPFVTTCSHVIIPVTLWCFEKGSVLCWGWAQETGQDVRTEKGRALPCALWLISSCHCLHLVWLVQHQN
jgi:hypothetical protein